MLSLDWCKKLKDAKYPQKQSSISAYWVKRKGPQHTDNNAEWHVWYWFLLADKSIYGDEDKYYIPLVGELLKACGEKGIKLYGKHFVRVQVELNCAPFPDTAMLIYTEDEEKESAVDFGRFLFFISRQGPEIMVESGGQVSAKADTPAEALAALWIKMEGK